MAILTVSNSSQASKVAVRVVDCDVHPYFRVADLPEYIAEPWRSRYYSENVDAETPSIVLFPPDKIFRSDASSGGDPPASDPAFVDRQLLQEAGVDYAILISLGPRAKADPEHEQAICCADNRWLAETWLSRANKHGRYRGSIRVCPQDPAGAVEEIEKWAGHPYFVQVAIAPESPAPFGQPQYHPIFEAAARHNLPVAIHVTRAPGMRLLTPAGFPSYHMEHYAQMPMYYMAHLTSLVFEGVFDRFENLRVAMIEGAYTWVAPLMWRLDRQWADLRAEIPEVRRRPSEIIRERVRFSTQPIEEPVVAEHLSMMTEWMDAGRVLMFATDYPHYDFDNPDWVLPRLPARTRDRVMFQNALDFYGLPPFREVGELDAPTMRA